MELTDDEADFMEKVFSSAIDPRKITSRSFKHYFKKDLPRPVIKDLLEKKVLQDLKTRPKSYSVKDKFDISNEVECAFCKFLGSVYLRNIASTC